VDGALIYYNEIGQGMSLASNHDEARCFAQLAGGYATENRGLFVDGASTTLSHLPAMLCHLSATFRECKLDCVS